MKTNMNGHRIFWFQDGLKLKVPAHEHAGIDSWSSQLMKAAGYVEFEHILVDPILCIDRMRSLLDHKNFSVAIDLTGSLGAHLMDTNIPVITDIHVSRIKNVTSERMDGVGNLFSKPLTNMRTELEQFDTSQPLLLDDVCWSGRTIEAAIRHLGLEPRQTTVACSVANNGKFGDTVPGGKERLQKNGVQIVSAIDVVTPSDDGFHMEDFLFHGEFDDLLTIQHMRETTNSSARATIEEILRNKRNELFPNSVSAKQLEEMKTRGLVEAPNGIPKRGFFDCNPPNWLLPSWSKRASWLQLVENKNDIINAIDELWHIRETAREPAAELGEGQIEISPRHHERW